VLVGRFHCQDIAKQRTCVGLESSLMLSTLDVLDAVATAVCHCKKNLRPRTRTKLKFTFPTDYD
jgi:hypothetical protein